MMTTDKVDRTEEEIRHLVAIGIISPLYSPWASGFVTGNKKSGELRFCSEFRPLNDVTNK